MKNNIFLKLFLLIFVVSPMDAHPASIGPLIESSINWISMIMTKFAYIVFYLAILYLAIRLFMYLVAKARGEK